MSRLRQLLGDLLLDISARVTHVPESITNDIPYVCQFSRAENAELILRKELALIDDPDWTLSGAKSPDEYAVWARAVCGMACLSMILDFYNKPAKKPIELAKEAKAEGVYYDNGDRGMSDMYYQPFAKWVQKYGLHATVVSRLSLRGIEVALAKGSLPVVSVSSAIREPQNAYCGRKGGHLVVVTGYDRASRTVCINNPSGLMGNNTQKNHTIPTKDFLRYFAHRGILVRSNE